MKEWRSWFNAVGGCKITSAEQLSEATWKAALEWMLKDFICKEGYTWIPGTFEYKMRQKIEEELND